MRNWILFVLVGAVLTWVIFDFFSEPKGETSVSKYDEETGEEGRNRGDIPFDFELETLEGETVRLSDYRGEKVMLNFWATWCPPCRAEMPDMQKFSDEYDITILAVNLTKTEESLAEVEEFIASHDFDFTVPLDKDYAVGDKYQLMAYPTSYMIDSKGRIQYVMMGAMNYDMMVEQFEMLE